ncbi:hypothetical protein CU313_06865 [Prochlorococcus marinus str. MU1404]|nr:hypothetical protein [Prochlorococcus marinus str. MU1404]
MGTFLTLDLIMRKFSVLILGCGNIASRFDKEIKKGFKPKTHGGAFFEHPGFSIKACMDIDKEKKLDFMKKFNVKKGFCNLKELSTYQEEFDVISICSPTSEHFDCINTALKLKPKIIFCEKPISENVAKSKIIVELCKNAKINLVINLSRRFDKKISLLKKQINQKTRGDLLSIVGFYNKGILNNGIHIIDLFRYLLGEIKIKSVGNFFIDFKKDDPTIPLWMTNRNNIPIFIGCNKAEDYSFFEMQFIFSRGVLNIENGGQVWRERKVINSTEYEGYKELDNGNFFAGGDSECMINAVDNIYKNLLFNEPLICTGMDALNAQILCEEAKMKSTKN